MYNDLDIIKKEKKKLSLNASIFALIYLIYFYYYLLRGSLIWIVYSIFVLIIVSVMFTSIIKMKEDKLRADYIKDDEFESTISTEFPIATLIPSFAALFYISINIIITIIEKGFELASVELTIYILVVISFISLSSYFMKKYFALSTLLYKRGIRNYSGDILFKDIKKFNFLKLKKTGYSFEINLGGEYHRFRVSEEQKWRIIELLELEKES